MTLCIRELKSLQQGQNYSSDNQVYLFNKLPLHQFSSNIIMHTHIHLQTNKQTRGITPHVIKLFPILNFDPEKQMSDANFTQLIKLKTYHDSGNKSDVFFDK